MNHPILKLLAPLALLLALLALSGCTNPDAPSTTIAATSSTSSPQNPGELPAPPPAPSLSQSPARVQPTPVKALAMFAGLYVNWTYQTLNSDQQTLAAISVGSARMAEHQAAASSHADTTITRGHIYNTGQIVSIARDLTHTGTWVIVTREQTGGSTEYDGLHAAYHVTLAKLATIPNGYAVEAWLPQT